MTTLEQKETVVRVELTDFVVGTAAVESTPFGLLWHIPSAVVEKEFVNQVESVGQPSLSLTGLEKEAFTLEGFVPPRFRSECFARTGWFAVEDVLRRDFGSNSVDVIAVEALSSELFKRPDVATLLARHTHFIPEHVAKHGSGFMVHDVDVAFLHDGKVYLATIHYLDFMWRGYACPWTKNATLSVVDRQRQSEGQLYKRLAILINKKLERFHIILPIVSTHDFHRPDHCPPIVSRNWMVSVEVGEDLAYVVVVFVVYWIVSVVEITVLKT